MNVEAGVQGNETARRVVYCVVPPELAGKLHEPLRRHFADDPSVEVIVDRRARDRRRISAARRAAPTAPDEPGRRQVRNPDGRRVGEQRATAVPLATPSLPRKARPFADRLSFIERLEPSALELEDLDTARLVVRFQQGHQEVFADLYRRYFDRIYGYLRVAFRDQHEAEDVTQHIFADVFESLPRYERRTQPFRAWLFIVARNKAVTRLNKLNRVVVTEPSEVDRRRESLVSEDDESRSLDWITDRELLLFVERLPLAQRQVLVMRYMLGLSATETAAALDRTPETVRQQQLRALRFLNQRLQTVGRAPKRAPRAGSRLLVPKARVLRARRFSLIPGANC